MKVKTRYIFSAVVVILIIGAFTVFFAKIKTMTDTNKVTLPSIDDVTGEYWAKLAEKKIFFGHQSVGYNIIDGIKDIISECNHIKLDIVETHDPAEFDHPIFAHSRIGRNTDPCSKIESFRNIIDAGVGNKVDIAFLKFCYIDIMRDSDPQKLLDSYKAAIEGLKDQYPEITFLHVTVPIRSAPKSAKGSLKQSAKMLIGKPGILDDNMMRQHYNKLLNDAYSKTEPVFDLALIESVNLEGFGCYSAKRGNRICVMAPEYTDDGGHLNYKGRKKIAEQMLIVLAQIANEL